MWSVENNLSIANMGFEEFVDAADPNGTYRGIPGTATRNAATYTVGKKPARTNWQEPRTLLARILFSLYKLFRGKRAKKRPVP
jgi:hypothetical protein